MTVDSRLVLGAAQFGQEYGSGTDRSAPSDQEVAEIVRLAAAAGVHDIDTARAYGQSEQVIGVARSVAPELSIVTKIRPLPDDGSVTSPQGVTDWVNVSMHESLIALRATWVDTVLLHRAADLDAGDGTSVRAVRALVAGGAARRWGVSLSTPEDLIRALDLSDLAYIQLPFNLVDRRWTEPRVTNAIAAHPDVHFTVRSAFLQGLLVGREPGRWPSVPAVNPRAIARATVDLTVLFGLDTAVQLAVAYVLGHSWVTSVVLGLRRPGQLDALLDAVARPPLTQDQISEVHHRIPPGPPDLVDPSRWPGISATTPKLRSR